ncbi:Adenylosuccinate synthetase [Thamnocephalis sphaerospora]|uniref:Adenylosuccinate synthetase n=1 Tax=Thamnocephalis sphaerospora TaxID=78915 RepID=A0A4P9XM93_9FUNG|nr:Adenylosuccinate synthetase [Thamnocephalis sphaerospora]|eukprot:RKP06966.1 Adenylosuccinate synthetase [Thamnocephalis sphaerospora]
MTTNTVDVVLGTQWGDEGKGKLSDLLAQQSDICARCQGGNNAGHTIVVDGKKYGFHLLPSGLINPKCIGLIGNGVVVHVPSLFKELAELETKGLKCDGRLLVSDRAHLVFDFHQIVDGLKEIELGGGSIGTTKRGIGPAYSSKASRSGIRVHHLYNWPEFEARFRSIVNNRHKRYGSFEYEVEAELERYKELAIRLRPMVVDSAVYLHEALRAGKRVLVEGANALMLDLDFGTYPFVTSSNCGVGGVCTGLGLPPRQIGNIIGVVKAYTTRVGAGPFPSEQLNAVGEHLQEVGREYGVTTGRRRRCGWLDMVVVRYSTMINGYTSINLTKLDVLDQLEEIKIAVAYHLNGTRLASFPADLHELEKVEVEYETLPGWKQDISACRTFESLPENARRYVLRIEQLLGVHIEWVGVGASRDAMIHRPQ